MARAFHYRDRHVFIRLFKQYVRPHLEFSTQARSPWTEADKSVLEKVQQRAVRMVSGLKSEYSERLTKLGLTTLEERRHQADMAMVHKILHGKGDLAASDWFDTAAGALRATRSTADPLNLRKRAGRLEVRRNFFSVRVVDDWNNIPSEVKSQPSCENFKNAYKKLRAKR